MEKSPIPFKERMRRNSLRYYYRHKLEIKKHRAEKARKYYATHPWAITLSGIRTRLKGSQKRYKKSYLDKGTKNYLSLNDLKNMFYRDKAYKMRKPSIHRKDNNGHYSIGNCIYIEHADHAKIHKKRK